MCFNWAHLAASILWDACWVNGIFPIFIDPGRGRSFHTGLSLDRVGFHCSLAGNISSRMLCLSEACFLFLVLTNTLPSITLPLLDGPHTPFLSCQHSVVHFPLFLSSSPLTPCLEHPSCHPWPCPIRPTPLVWCVSLAWPFQERRTNKNGRRNRKRQGGGITDASGRWAGNVNEIRCITWMHVIRGFPCVLILQPAATDDSQATTA